MHVSIDGASIYVNVEGQGQDALLLHGVPDSADIWNSVIDRIQSSYRCFAPDLPGMARSEIPKNYEFNFENYADFVDKLVEKLELKNPITLIVHDWGGIYGLLWACKYPHKVKRIIGGDFPFSHLYKWHEWATIWRTPVLGELSMALMNWPVFKWELKRSSQRLTTKDMRKTYQQSVTNWQTRFMVLKLYRSADVDQFTHWQSKLKLLSKDTPIDVVWGNDDPHVPVREAYMMNPNSLKIVENCGHWTPSEAPEEFSQVILRSI